MEQLEGWIQKERRGRYTSIIVVGAHTPFLHPCISFLPGSQRLQLLQLSHEGDDGLVVSNRVSSSHLLMTTAYPW
jgi:hypothetical protein